METNTKSIIFLPTLQDMFVMTPKNWDDKDASIRESEMKKVVMEAANRTYCTYRSTLSRYYRSVMFDEERLSHPPDGVAHSLCLGSIMLLFSSEECKIYLFLLI